MRKKLTWWICMMLLVLNASVAYAHKGHKEVPVDLTKVDWGLKGLQELSNVHPLFVHFPIVLLLGAIALYLLGSIFKKEGFLKTGKWTLCLGTLSAAVTVWTGLKAAEVVPHGGNIHPTMMIHQYFGVSVLILSCILSAWVLFSKSSLPAKGRIFFLTALVLLGLILTKGADFGGQLVYLYGVGVKTNDMAQMMEGYSPSESSAKDATAKVSENVWSEIKSHQEHLAQVINEGQLDQVHEIAFMIRDMVKALPDRTLSADQKIVFQSLLKEVEREASLLDEYGDAGDKGKAQAEREKFEQTLLSIKRLYGQS